MDLIGLLASIFEAATNIDLGRKGFATKGIPARKGMGIKLSMSIVTMMESMLGALNR